MKARARSGRDRAIVIGGSIAGLVTAGALAEHFREVTVLERDVIENAVMHRRGVPQGRHSHVLLASGLRAVESLFPGIGDDFARAGAIKGDVTQNVRWFVEGDCMCRFTSGIDGFGMSRPLFERVVRERVVRSPNVRLRDNAEVKRLCATGNRRRVVGVASSEEEIGADLIVDASGRGSRTPRWLEDLGYERPTQERVGIELRYTTRLFRKRPYDLEGDNAIIIPPTPTGKRGGGMIAQEDGRWIVTLITHFGEFASPDLAGFVAFAKTLPVPDIYNVIRDAEPIGEPETIRIPASVRHRYERLTRFPAGYLVTGDAISSFNPIYGQGMSVAALQAVELRTLLAAERRSVARSYFCRAAKIVDAAWSISAGNDFRMPEAIGRRTAGVALANWYVPKLLRAGHRDARAARAFFNVSNLLASPRSLLHPTLLRLVTRGSPKPHVTAPDATTRRAPLP